jgi:NTE family protein
MKKYFALFVCISICVLGRAQSPYRNLVFEGGGVRGLAYAGALKVLEEKGVLQQIERTAGTSAGAIVALMISLGYSAAEVDSIMMRLKVEAFNDGGGSILGGIKRMKKTYGWYRGEKFERWLEQIIATKTGNPNLSFKQLHELRSSNPRLKEFYCTGVNITQQRLEIFSWEHSPGMLLKTAVRISGSIPLYFRPVFIDSSGREVKKPKPGYNYQLYVDGGMISNYPIGMFDTCGCTCNPLTCNTPAFNNATLGLKLERPEQIEQFKQSNDIPPYTINNLSQYLNAFSNLLLETMNRRGNMENEKGRTIYISYGDIQSKVRKMKDEQKRYLFANGQKAAQQFLTTNAGSSGAVVR